MAEEKRPTLTVDEREERGSREVRRLRRTGSVPGVIYGGRGGAGPDGAGGAGDAVSFKVDSRELRHVLVDGSALFDVKVGGGKARPVIVKEQQFHPVRDELLHIDLLEVRLDETIQSTVAIELEGVEEAPGVKEGGVLEHVTRELNIEALPTDIPDQVTVNVSHMEIAATLALTEVNAPAGVTFLDDPEETVIATVVPPTEVEEPEEVEEETELVGEEGELLEGEEVPAEEGEEPAEATEGGEQPQEGEES